MDDVWNIVFTQKPDQECLRGFDIAVALQEDAEHESVLVHGPPQPVSNAVHARTYFVERPTGTPAGFPLAQVFSNKGGDFHAPLAQRLVADLNAALVEHFLHISVTRRKAMIEPPWAHWMIVIGKRPGVPMGVRFSQDTVAIGLRVGYGGSAYPNPMKATQPRLEDLGFQTESVASRGVFFDKRGFLRSGGVVTWRRSSQSGISGSDPRERYPQGFPQRIFATTFAS